MNITMLEMHSNYSLLQNNWKVDSLLQNNCKAIEFEGKPQAYLAMIPSSGEGFKESTESSPREIIKAVYLMSRQLSSLKIRIAQALVSIGVVKIERDDVSLKHMTTKDLLGKTETWTDWYNGSQKRITFISTTQCKRDSSFLQTLSRIVQLAPRALVSYFVGQKSHPVFSAGKTDPLPPKEEVEAFHNMLRNRK